MEPNSHEYVMNRTHLNPKYARTLKHITYRILTNTCILPLEFRFVPNLIILKYVFLIQHNFAIIWWINIYKIMMVITIIETITQQIRIRVWHRTNYHHHYYYYWQNIIYFSHVVRRNECFCSRHASYSSILILIYIHIIY